MCLDNGKEEERLYPKKALKLGQQLEVLCEQGEEKTTTNKDLY